MSKLVAHNYADVQAERIITVVTQTRVAMLRRAFIMGAVWLISSLILWLLLAVALDIIWPLSVPFRIAACVIGVTCAITATAVFILRPWLQQPDDQHTAFLIERTMPNMHSRLVTALDIGIGRETTGPRDPAFVQRLMEQTSDRLSNFHASQVIDHRPLRLSIITLTALILLSIGTAILLQDRAATAITRIFRPTAQIPPASWVQYTAVPGDVEVLQGEPTTLFAHFNRGGPASLNIMLRKPGGAWQKYPMTPDAMGQPAFALSAVNESAEYQIQGAGTWTNIHRITMIRRPIVEQLTVGVTWPEYMGVREVHPVERLDSLISSPQGSSIHVTAKVSGDPIGGNIKLYKPIATMREVELDREAVWFDDDVPIDAEISGTWNWTAERVYSGARACAPHWSRTPFGFTTRLHRTRLQPDSSFFIYTYIDAQKPPRDITIQLKIQDQPYQLIWRAKDAPTKPGGTTIDIDAMPSPGQWIRLEAPIAKILGSRPATPVVLSGIVISVNNGRADFDRAGVLERRKETITEQSLEPGETLLMEREGDHWTGTVPVAREGLFSLEFINGRNDPSPSMKPVAFTATPDQPPSVLVEKPAANVTLTQAEPIPLMLRVFDDYGIADVGIEYGPEPGKPTETRWISHFEKPEPSHLLFSSLDPTTMGVAPGTAMHYRFLVRDRKGQTAYSDSYRLAIVAPNVAPPADAAAPAPPLRPLLEGLEALLGVQTRIVAAAASTIAKLPQAARKPATELRNDRLTKDGKPMTPEEVRAFHQARIATLTQEQRDDVKKLDDEYALQREQALRLAQKIEDAARDAARSPTAIPAEIAAMQSLAQQVRDIAGMDAEHAFEEAAALGRSVEMRDLTVEQRAKLQELQRQLADMATAREAFRTAPDQAQAQMSALLTDLEAARALDKMDKLDDALASRGEQLEALQDELAALSARTPSTPSTHMADLSKEQTAFDAEAIRVMEESRNLVAEQMAGRAAREDEMPPEPWEPPGQTKTAQPAKEADAPDPSQKPGDNTAVPQQPPEDDAWDQPIDEPAIHTKVEQDPQLKDEPQREQSSPSSSPSNTKPQKSNPRDQPENGDDVSNPQGGNQPSDPTTSPTPRQSMASHQQEMAKQIANRQKQLDAARQQVRQLANQISNQAQQMRDSSPDNTSQMSAALSRMLSSEAVRRAMTAGDRAATSKQSAARAASSQAGTSDSANPSQQPGANSLSGAQPGSMSPTDAGMFNLTSDNLGPRATAVYRLPPRLREPLIQGMRERGPEAYQAYIDAYYRSLSKDAK